MTWLYKASLNGVSRRVSCTLNSLPHQQEHTFCMKLGGERMEKFHHGETNVGNGVKPALRVVIRFIPSVFFDTSPADSASDASHHPQSQSADLQSLPPSWPWGRVHPHATADASQRGERERRAGSTAPAPSGLEPTDDAPPKANSSTMHRADRGCCSSRRLVPPRRHAGRTVVVQKRQRATTASGKARRGRGRAAVGRGPGELLSGADASELPSLLPVVAPLATMPWMNK